MERKLFFAKGYVHITNSKQRKHPYMRNEDLGDVQGVVLDLDGTVYTGETVIPGAPAVVNRLRSSGFGVRFATNTTRQSRRALVERLRQFRIDVEAEDLVTAPMAAATWLRERQIRTVALYVANAGRADFDEFRSDKRSPGAVVVGDLGSAWTFDLLNRAFRQLLGGAELLAIQRNRYWKTADDFVLDAGPFVAALEYASGKQAVTIGKPSAAFFEAAARSLGLPMSKLVMVGDDVVADVEGAIATGLQGVLVRTGKFRPSDLERETPPDAVLDSIAELPRLLLGEQ